MHPKILIVPGSNRGGSHNVRLAACAHKVLSNLDCEPTRISLRDYTLPLVDEDLLAQKGTPANALKLARLFHAHNAVLLVSPEYNASLPPLMKNVLDWMSMTKKDDQGEVSPIKNNLFAICGASPGSLGAIRAMSHTRDILTSIGGTVIAQQFGLANADKAFDEMDNLTSEFASDMLQKTCSSLVDTARLMAK